MTLVNDVRFPAEFDLTLTGTAEDGRSEPIQIPPQFVGASSSIVTDRVEFARIANLLPKTLRLKGKALIGRGFEGSPASVHKDDLVKASIHFEAPLIFTLPPATNTSKVDTIKIKEDAREKIRKNALDAKLVFEIDNAVPLGATVSFCFGDTLLASVNDTLFYTYADLIKTISLDSARTRIDPTNPNVRIVSQASTNAVSLGLSKAELKIFESPEVFWQWRISFLGTSGMVKVRPEDYIRVRARIEATVNTDFEKDDKEKGGGS
jgi:putative transposon-encoded protein